MMRVLYITTMYPTPAFPQKGIFCHEQVKALKKLGVDVSVAVPIPFYEKMREREWDFEGVHIDYIRFFKLPGTRDFHKTGIALYKRLKKRFDISSFDLLHADCALPSGHAAMIAAAEYKKPFIVHGHGLDVFLDNSYRGARNCGKIADISAAVYKQANAVTGVSRKVLDNIQERVDIRGKDYVIYNGVDTKRFKPDPEKPRSDILRLVSVGNLIPLKGHDLTIKALKKLRDEGYENFSLTIAGRGPMEKELKDLVSDLRLSDKVSFTGYVPYDEVIKLLQRSDVFVLPSWYEALGCVYLEAMACGLITIGCNNNGIDEIIVDRVTGFLIPTHSDEELVSLLADISNMSKAEIDYISAKARQSMVEKYTWMISAKTLRKVYLKYAIT